MSETYPGRAYIVCCDARTGSSLLVSTLRATGRAGKPYEYFGRAEIDKPWMREQLHVPDDVPFTTFSAWRDYILKAGSELGGVFGATVHWFQAGDLHEAFRGEDAEEPLLDALRRFFPDLRLIRLERRNIVAQAISHYVAICTNVWNSTSARGAKRGEVDVRAPYDFDRIDHQVTSALVSSEGWRRTLEGAEAITMRLAYEELAADLPGSVRRVFAHIGVDPGDAPLGATALEKQAGSWSVDMESRYREERRQRGLGPVGDEGRI